MAAFDALAPELYAQVGSSVILRRKRVENSPPNICTITCRRLGVGAGRTALACLYGLRSYAYVSVLSCNEVRLFL